MILLNKIKRNKLSGSNFGILLFAILLGLFVSIGAGLFELAFSRTALFIAGLSKQGGIQSIILSIIMPLIGGVIIYFFIKNTKEKRQHNPADIISGIHIYKGKLDSKTCSLSIFASLSSLGFGFSVGHYAPIVVLGSIIGSLFFKLKAIAPIYIHISIGAGAAAAIAAIFHTPIAAVIFVHEVLFRFFSVRAFAPITIAAVTSYISSNYFFGKDILFPTVKHFQPEPAIYLLVAFSAIIAAIIGITFIKSVLKLQKISNNLSYSIRTKIIISALTVGIISIFIPEILGNSQATLKSVLSGENFALKALLYIFVAKIIVTTICIGMGIPGGIFGPAIFFGALVGSIISISFDMAFPGLISNTDIIVITSMAALASSVLGAPITMILIVIEITSDYQITSAVMLAVVIANITSFRFMGATSFFDMQLKARGFDMDVGRDQIHLQNRNITKFISDKFIKIIENTSYSEAKQRLIEANDNNAYIVDDEGNYLGVLSLIEIEIELQSDINKIINREDISLERPVLYQANSVWVSIQRMEDFQGKHIAVIDSENNPKLLGVIYEKDLIHNYLDTAKRLRLEENATKDSS